MGQGQWVLSHQSGRLSFIFLQNAELKVLYKNHFRFSFQLHGWFFGFVAYENFMIPEVQGRLQFAQNRVSDRGLKRDYRGSILIHIDPLWIHSWTFDVSGYDIKLDFKVPVRQERIFSVLTRGFSGVVILSRRWNHSLEMCQ